MYKSLLSLVLILFINACSFTDGNVLTILNAQDPSLLDSDGDGVIDSKDAFPHDANESADFDNDGVGNNADQDDDNDGVSDDIDISPLNAENSVAPVWNLNSLGALGLSAQNYSGLGAFPIVRVVDLDSDQDLDIVACSENCKDIDWFENQAGNIQPRVRLYSDVYSAYGVDMLVRDMDGDQDMDIIVLLQSSSAAENHIIYENNGTETFVKNPVGSIGFGGYLAMAIEDMNNDDRPDIVSGGSGQGRLYWHENEGNGQYTTTQIIAATSNHTPALVIGARDINGDDYPDIIYRSGSGIRISWHENDGNEGFATIHHIDTADRGILVDIDKDGDVDVLAPHNGVVTAASWTNLFKNDGSGNFQPAVKVSDDALGWGDTLHSPSSLVADFDNDGDIDVIQTDVPSFANSISWFENTDLAFTRKTLKENTSLENLQTADLNQDGVIDVVGTAGNDMVVLQQVKHSISVSENTTSVTSVVATDGDNQALIYSIAAGDDQQLFSINSSSGQLSFKTGQTLTNANDADGNHTYEVTLQASDGESNTGQITLHVDIIP